MSEESDRCGTGTLAERIQSLYQQSPSARMFFEVRNSQAYLQRRMEELKERFPADLSLATLDSHEKEHARGVYSPFLELISYLPPEGVFEEFGEEVLFWAFCHAPFERREVLLHQYAQLSKKDKGKLELALHTEEKVTYHLSSNLNSRAILKTYHFLEFLQKGDLTGDPSEGFSSSSLKNMLQACALPGVILSEQRLAAYRLEGMIMNGTEATGYERNWHYPKHLPEIEFELFLDAPLAISLLYKNEPQGLCSFWLEDQETLLIRQLQGVQKKKKYSTTKLRSHNGLAPLDWIKFFLSCTAQLAQQFEITTISIQGGENNHYTRVIDSKTGKLKLELQKALQRYDDNARRFGFEQRKDGNWYIATEQVLKWC